MNVQTNLGSIIAQLRRQANMTQADLAEKLGITAQAVSQWERGETLPDILTLPVIAEIFGCSIDALYSGEAVAPAPAEAAGEPAETAETTVLPADGVWRAVVMCGDRIVDAAALPEDIRKSAGAVLLNVSGSISGGLHSAFSVAVTGNVQGEVNCGPLSVLKDIEGNVHCGALQVKGNIGGDVKGGAINVSGTIGGNAQANGGLTVGVSVGGNATAGGGLSVSGSICGSASAGGGISMVGNVEGNVTAGGDIRIDGDVGGDVHGERSVTVGGSVAGDAVGLNKEADGAKGPLDGVLKSASKFVGDLLDSFKGSDRSFTPGDWETAPEGEYQAVLMRDGVIVDTQVIPQQGERVLIQIPGDAGSVRSMFSVAVSGSVDGDVTAHAVGVEGDVSGDIHGEAKVSIGGDIDGDVDCGDLTAEGDIGGDVDCGALTVGGDISGDVDCGALTVNGSIDGDVDCGALTVNGDIDGDVDCGEAKIGGSVSGDINAEKSVTVEGDVNGDVTADTVTVGGSVRGDIDE